MPFRLSPPSKRHLGLALALLGVVAACSSPLETALPEREADLRPPEPPGGVRVAMFGFGGGWFNGGPGAAAQVTPTPPVAAAPVPAVGWHFSGLPTPVPVLPVPGVLPGGNAPNGITLRIIPLTVLHPASSHVLGTVRNHVVSMFPNGLAKLARVRDLAPTWGARRQMYRVGHGITDGRNDYAYMTGYHFEQCWGAAGPYPYDDLRSALSETQTMGADSLHVINFGTGTPDEAGRYVSYLNHPGDANKALYPCNAEATRFFELGNEISWRMERGHDAFAPTETAYAQRARDFARSMRQNSDTPLQIGAVASTNSSWTGDGWSNGAAIVRNVLGVMGTDVDFLTYHGYPSWPVYRQGDLWTIMAQNEWQRRMLETQIKPAIAAAAPGRDVWIANTEYGVNLYNDTLHGRGLFAALYAADTIALAMNEDIRVCEQFCFDHGNQADAAYFFNDDANSLTALYKLHSLIAHHWGDQIVSWSASNVPTHPVAGAATQLDVPLASFAAATSADGKTVYVLALNRSNDTDLAVNLALGFQPSALTRYTLTGPGGWDAANGDVSVGPSALGAIALPRASVTVLEARR